MNLFEILKQFKNIEPDPTYVEKSKRMIFAAPQTAPVSIKMGIFRFLETGAAFVLAGFFILLITGGLNGQQSLAPVQYSVIDPQGLRAEAQAVDMQIQLTNISYPAVTVVGVTSTAESTPSSATATKSLAAALMPTPTSTATSSNANAAALTPTSTTTASTTPSSTLSIDQALQQLSQ